MKKTACRILCLALCAALCLAVPAGCAEEPAASRSGTRYLFDTVITVTVYDFYTDKYYRQTGRERPDLEAALAGALDLCEHYDDLFSRTEAGSDVSRINASAGQPVEVDPETADLLQKTLSYSRLTHGAFDVTIAPVSTLWDFAANDPALPDLAELAAGLEKVDYSRLEVDGNTVTLPAGCMVDLGGAAKGYIADRVGDYLESQGVDCYLLNLGGNVLAAGGKADRAVDGPEALTPFAIGLRKPFGTTSELAGEAGIANGSVVTSGTYERCFTLDGRLYHHILDPDTGYPVDNGLDSVTIFSEASADGDILSTSLFVLGPQAGLALAESLEGVDALFLLSDGSRRMTSGLAEDADGDIRWQPA